jgi:hypothetical protein
VGCSDIEELRKLTRVTLLRKGRSPVDGTYDGYGRFSPCDINKRTLEIGYKNMEAGRSKWVLTEFYDGETFEVLGKSCHEPGQGHFHDPRNLLKWLRAGGFDTQEQYEAAYREQ